MLCTIASLKVPAIVAFDVVTMVLDTEKFPLHTIAELNSSITFICSVRRSFTVEENKHKHTHARTHAQPSSIKELQLDQYTAIT